MREKAYDEKYGIDSSDSKVKSFHSSRRMFVIKDGKLFLAPENVAYSHAEWFEIMGWMSVENDSLMVDITRGYFDSTGIYFYKGYDFNIDEISEKDIFLVLERLVKDNNISMDLHLFGGKIKQNDRCKWLSRKDYGPIRKLL